MDLASLHDSIRSSTDEALSQLIDALPSHAPQLRDAMRYALLAGGKRMRPLLVHLVGNALNIPQIDQTAIGVAIECIHAYSLAHDDLPAMDDDDLRRGKPTCHIAFDEATAILAGDALQTLAFSHLCETPLSDYAQTQRSALLACLAKASGYVGMCGGQAMDLAATGKNISLQDLTQLHRLKTGALLCACVEMMTIASPAIESQDKQSLIKFAQAVGLAFQVQDDILDVIADTQQLGKPKGSDEEQGKSTYPALLGLEGAQQELRRLHSEALQALSTLPYNTDYLLAFSDLMVNRNH